MQCEHEWNLVKGWEDVKKVDKLILPVYKSKWVCSKCGTPRLLEFMTE